MNLKEQQISMIKKGLKDLIQRLNQLPNRILKIKIQLVPSLV